MMQVRGWIWIMMIAVGMLLFPACGSQQPCGRDASGKQMARKNKCRPMRKGQGMQLCGKGLCKPNPGHHRRKNMGRGKGKPEHAPREEAVHAKGKRKHPGKGKDVRGKHRDGQAMPEAVLLVDRERHEFMLVGDAKLPAICLYGPHLSFSFEKKMLLSKLIKKLAGMDIPFDKKAALLKIVTWQSHGEICLKWE